jgi:CubicO group peptidase (beta-lactamase class C family)
VIAVKYRILQPLLATLFVLTALGQTRQIYRPDGEVIDTITINGTVKKLMDTAQVTGLCLGIINDNKVAFVHAYGFKNKTKNEQNDTATCFDAASLSKPLFAYLVMQLRDKGVIDLDKPLYTYLPKPLSEYDNYKDLAGDERWKLITARHCLDHTTGFPNWRQLNPRQNQKLEIFFTPGERYAYSGEGLCLLQMVVETITNRQLEDLAQEHIFRPFGMRRSSYVWQTSFENDYAVGHDMNEDTLPKYKRTRANAAGSLETTVADWARFIEAVMQGKGLSQQSRQEMFSAQIGINTKRQFPSLNTDTTSDYRNIQLSYGLGWGLFKSAYGWAFFKEGHDDGWEHYCIGFPDRRQSLITMTNSSNGESVFKELLEKTFGVAIPWKWEGYAPYRASVNVPTGTLDTYVGTYSMSTDSSMRMIISRDKDRVFANASFLQERLQFVFLSDTKFEFRHVMDVKGEFIIEPGKPTKFTIDDSTYGVSEWMKNK